MIGPLHQNDERLLGEPSIKPYGCYAVTIRQICEARAERTLSPEKILEWYGWCVSEGAIRDDKDGPGADGQRLRAFVMDAERVGKAAQYYLGVPQSFRYVFRRDRYDDGPKDFGRKESANAFIAQGRIKGWRISHFFEADSSSVRIWDPFWPAKPVEEILSLRGFAL